MAKPCSGYCLKPKHPVNVLQSDFKASKQYRKLLKLLTADRIQRPMLVFKRHAMVLVAALLAVHLCFYMVFSTSIKNLHQ
jgi:hypothetical protein